MSQWLASYDPETDESHAAPLDDLIRHELAGDDCPCGPRCEPVERADGSVGWLYVHHSLDGREATE